MATKEVIMVQALSNDLRRRVVEDVSAGMSRRGASRKYRVSPSFVIKLVRQYEQTGDYRPRKRGGDRRSYLGPYSDFIEGLIRENNSVTLMEVHERLKNSFGLVVHISILDRFIRKAGWRYKKNGARQRAGS